MNTLDTTTASLATLRAALKAADAYSGVARFSLDAMRHYARKVQVLRMDGETATISAANVDQLLAIETEATTQPEATTAELVAQLAQSTVWLAPATEATTEQPEATTQPAPAKKANQRGAANEAAVELMLALGTVGCDAFTACTGKNWRTYMSASAWTSGETMGQPATWNPLYTACVRMGVQATFTKVDGEKQLVLVRMDDAAADAQRAALEAGKVRYAAAKAARKAAKAAADA